ncbi:hypothetical protein EV586_102352 [Tumebacillus sp. BK434]|uniref:sulfite exporter TauE/SafE family protein n=1 Tax=Tumebacillus sp. BK434 TaxID=2512169 RepID=UPI001053EDA5|nr:sulfite exporter TauE/SafE family protein [Tumebacillus sp. BK434]TCP57905.1 hypothetical protein EV586_102352 [Tumebacillus sp. BK434]
MEIGLIITLFLIGFAGAFLSGMLGIGGAIINYPLLLFLPALLGVGAFTAHEVSGMVAVQVLTATFAGAMMLRKEKVIHVKLVLCMGTAILIGSFAGGYGGMLLPGTAVNLVYAVLATLAAVMMLLPQRGCIERPLKQVEFNRGLAAGAALLVGAASGIVGAGGAFLLVPVMLKILKIPIRVTIASSLAITFLSSIGSVAGKLASGPILLEPTLVLVAASVLAAPLGTRFGRQVNPRLLQAILSLLIVGTTLKIWSDLLHTSL